jgi:hypothetical protein
MRMFPAACAVLLAAGCVYTIHPIYVEAERVLMPELVGTWGGESPLVRLTIAQEPDSTYLLIYTDEEGKTDRFVGRITSLAERRVLDVEPERSVGDHGDSYEAQLLTLHSFFLLGASDRWLRVQTLNADSLRAFGKAHPGGAVVIDHDGTALLPAETADLRRLVATLAARPGFFGLDSLVRLVPAPEGAGRR